MSVLLPLKAHLLNYLPSGIIGRSLINCINVIDATLEYNGFVWEDDEDIKEAYAQIEKAFLGEAPSPEVAELEDEDFTFSHSLGGDAEDDSEDEDDDSSSTRGIFGSRSDDEDEE